MIEKERRKCNIPPLTIASLHEGGFMVSQLAGTLTTQKMDTEFFRRAFYEPAQTPVPVKFGTSGHRGTLGEGFCALHAKAIAQAVARIHLENHITGPILVGGDTRLMSQETAKLCAEVLAGNGLPVILPDMPVPTPVFSFEIRSGRACACLNGTASHNPPQEMGLKYNPSHGGPADGKLTAQIEKYANEYMASPAAIKSMPLDEARTKGLVKTADVLTPYVEALGKKIDFKKIASSSYKFAIHPLGGTSLPFYRAIKEKYGLNNVDIVSDVQDPTFYFIPLDHDGKIRMDPSSQYPMKPLIELVQNGSYHFAGASDPDADRFGCATAKGGLIAPNHALCVMADYLVRHHRVAQAKAIGRTLGTTALLDRIAQANGLELDEVNVGFKYFVEGLDKGRYVLAGEESAGMSVSGWTTEKDGIFAVCLLMEIQACEGDVATLYQALTEKYGVSHYTRVDIPTNAETKQKVKAMKASDFTCSHVAGETVTRVRDTDGIKVYLENSWFLVRPSGTENILKIYAETFTDENHLQALIAEAQKIVA
ncbi:MAG: alpha-D-glucose phosphate-specific phosphoglucomutase [Elusimicrobiaceae bacterium]|nr:alpha-D-glucose phosphate-specific phosphoglucomutase [Elusimicrobiaceae bacterium]